jgi:drug/metabolite transporter (DMT)-like permease
MALTIPLSQAPARPGDRPLLGVLCLVAGVAVFSVHDLIIKLISDTYPVHEAMAIRGMVAVPLLLALVARSGGLRTIRTKRAPLLAVRGLLMLGAYTSFFLGLAALPMAIAVSLYFVAPIFVTLLSALTLGERVGPHRWTAVVVGFIGILLVSRPTADVFEPAALLPILSGLLYAVSAVLARKLGVTESAGVMALYANAIYLLGGLLLGAAFTFAPVGEASHKSLAFLVRAWATPSAFDLTLLAFCGVVACIGTVLLTQGYRLAQASTVAPYEYTALIWSLAYGWVFWREFPDAVAWAGIVLVVVSGLWTLSRAARQAPRRA